jgi:hypothetical protein
MQNTSMERFRPIRRIAFAVSYLGIVLRQLHELEHVTRVWFTAQPCRAVTQVSGNPILLCE